MSDPTGPLDGGVLPRLRPDLERFSWPARGETPAKHFVRDPKTLLAFEFGEAGLFLCDRLDGKTGLDDIFGLYEERFGTSLSPRDFDLFVRQLADNGLLDDTPAARRRRTFAEILDPEVFLPLARFKLMKGDRLLAFLGRRLSWLFSRRAQYAGAAAIVCALFVLALNWGGYASAVWLAWGPGFVLMTLFVSCFLVQSPRALVHGIMCKRYGGQVSGIGLGLLYYVMPALYCDWGEIIWIADKTRRRWAIFSGIYYQLLIWACGMIGWGLTTPGSEANAIWLSVSFGAGMGLLLFGANPLVQMDGYLLLVSFVEVPRLRERSLAILGSWCTRRPLPEILTRRERRWFLLYGSLTFIYAFAHLGVVLGMFWNQLTPLYEGAGAMVTIFAAFYLAHKPIASGLARLPPLRRLFARNTGWRGWVARLTLAGALVAAGFIRVDYETGGEFRLLPSHRAEARSDIESMVEQVLVREGQWVEAGQPIATLSVRSHQRDLETARGELEKAQAELRLAKQGARPEEIGRVLAAVKKAETSAAWSRPRAERYTRMYQDGLISQNDYEIALRQRDMDAARLRGSLADLNLAESGPRREQIQALEARIRGLKALADNYATDVERTTLVSPIAGRVVTPRVEGIRGTYLTPGLRDRVMEIEDARTLHADIEVNEEEIAGVRPGAPVRLAVWTDPGAPFDGRVLSIAPVAAPTASAATVATVTEDSADVATLRIPGLPYRFVRVLSEVPNPDGRLKTEMTGYAKIPTGKRPLWDVLYRPIARWLRVKVWYLIP